MSDSTRVKWMKQMVRQCFDKTASKDDSSREIDNLTDKFLNFLKGKLGKTLIIYYQKVSNDKQGEGNYQYIINEQAKSSPLMNRACFFIRMIAQNKECSLTNQTEPDVIFGEISSEAIIGMSKVIYNFLGTNLELIQKEKKKDDKKNAELENGEWGNQIKPEQIDEFKKVLKSFSKDMNDTVDSLIRGVKFQELPQTVKDYIKEDKKDYYKDDDKIQLNDQIEKIFENWINVLSQEIDDVDKENPQFSDDGPRSELEKWKYRMQRLTKVNDFFKSPDYKAVNRYFIDQKNKLSTKIQSSTNDMKQKKIEAHTALSEARDNVKYLSTLEIYFEPLYNGNPDTIIDSLQSLMNSLKLISFTARYYDSTKMTNLFSKITSQMINNCIEYILDKKQHPENIDAKYLWEVSPDILIARFEKCIELYKTYKQKYKDAKTNTTSSNRENNFEFGENQLFGKFDSFCKRLLKLIELFTTIKQFDDIKKHKLDSMENIQAKYEEKLLAFKDKASQLLRYSETKFDKDYVAFNLSINEIENELHKIIGEEFKKLNWIEKKLKLLAKYEKILTKPNLQQNLRSEKLEIFTNYKREIDLIQATFDSNRTNPKLQRNMPKISGRIKWAKHLFNRIFPFIHSFKDISAKDRKETELSYMTTNTILQTYVLLNENFFNQFVESVKPKLTLPLLVINENSSPKVNLDLYVLQLIREAKCMLRMNCEIPEAAKIILLQEEKYKRYYNELSFMVKEYNRILSRINRSVAEYYFKGHIKDLNLKLTPLKSTINWSSMNIESSLNVVFQCLQRFEYSIDSFMEILDNRVHRNMLTIRKLDLLFIPENPTNFAIPDIISKQDAHVQKQNEFLKNKNKEIESAILDMIASIKAYEIDPKIAPVDDKTLYKLITDYEDKFYEFLIATTKNSLIHLKDRINGESSQPIFQVEIILTSNKININPKIDLIQEAINKIAKSILYATKNIKSWKKLDSDESVSFHEKVGKDNEIVKMILVLTGSFQSNNVQIDKYLKDTFDPFKPIWTDSIEKKIKDFNNKKNKTYSDYEEKLNEYHKIEDNINAIPDIKNIGAIALNLKTIKDSLLHYIKDWETAYMRQLLLATKGTNKELNSLLDNFEEKLGLKGRQLEDIKLVVEAIENIRINEGSIEDKIKPFVLLYGLTKKYLSETDFERYNFPTKNDFEEKWKRILVKAGEIRDDLQKNQLEYKKELYEKARELKEMVAKLREEYDNEGPVKAKDVENAFDRLDTYRRKVQNLKKIWTNIQSAEKIFNVTPNNYPDLQNMEEDLKILGTLYDLYKDILTQIDEWKDLEFNKLKDTIEDMNTKVGDFRSRFMKINKSLESNPKYGELKSKIDTLNNQIEVFEQLTNDKLEDYHFAQMAEYTGIKDLATAKSDGGIFKLKVLFENNVEKKREDIEDTCKLANIQRKVRDQLNEIEEEWKTKEFKFEPHKTHQNIMLLDPISSLEIKEVVEEHAGKVAGFKSQSRNLTDELRTRIKQKELQFQTINSTLELWLSVQQLWNSLQSFFIGGDIRKELPGPTKNFENCHKLWIKIMMDKAYPLKKVMELCGSNELTPDLQEIDRTLKECQQKLDLYLEGKRGQFPRFYFVSNSVLLDILSKRSDPANIKSNLGIIFDAVNDIEFETAEKKSIIKIEQVKNKKNNDIQIVDMTAHPVKCDGKIEEWLGDLVKSMQLSLKDLFALAYLDVKKFFPQPIDDEYRNEFKEFINHYICQVVLFGLQLFGTKRLEQFIVRTSVEKGDSYKKKLVSNPNEVDPSMKDFEQIMHILTELCRAKNNPKLITVKLEAIIIIHVHNIDIYKYFIEDKDMARQIVTVNDYEWLKQTRVYWYEKYSPSRGETIKTALINITDVPFEYGYEFLGARERMCITPLTDKCYITLAQAMGMYYGGAPAGPAGTGKTETVKDMGRTMGVFVLVTNCAPEHRYKNMAEIFKGLSQSGAWGCFDEFNRICLEVLSVLATIIAAIQECRKKGDTKFKFPESANTYKDCDLIPTMGYFITMNPGYAGRQELPENLKILFRGVTMMAPNRESIIRVKLCSYGFAHHDEIAKKFRKLYELCEAQLSKQQHYDFGLRNILSVLRHGGNEKKNIEEESKEEELIYKALDGMNTSKLVPDDKGLFKNLIKDVFPAQEKIVKVPDPSLNEEIDKILDREKLSKFPIWKDKIFQTNDTYQVRHGFMVVGVTATGKTTIMNVLTEALSVLAAKKNEPKWAIHRLNPKAVENEYLFIQKIEDNYVLGVFTNIWKKCNESSSPDSKKNNWIVCDGPIDAIWIENLNTVLDDNKILTLSNNERIAMQESCRLVMEVENVKNASLATVSRCGMIYMTETDITVTPLIEGWFNRKKEDYKADVYKKIDEKDLKTEISKLISKNEEDKLFKEYNPCMQVSFLIKAKNFFLLLDALLGDKAKVMKEGKPYILKILAFAFAWAVGSFYEGKEREKFHKHLAEFKYPMPELKNERTIFEYSLEGNWEPWAAAETKITRNELENFSKLLVPTLDSTRAIFLIQQLSKCRIDNVSERCPPCLLLGDAGTAKTSTVLLYQKTFDIKSEENDSNIKRALKRVNFSSATSPTNFQETVNDELEKSGAEFVPILERNLVIFIDDLSMPYVNKWGDQVTLELVRQLLEFSSYYSIDTTNRGELIKINKISYVAAMNHPKGGKNDIPNRLKRHFFIFNMVLPNNESVNNIYLTFINAFFQNKKFAACQELVDESKELPRLTSILLKRMSNKFQPTPVKFHYSYNMRELSRTFQGLFKVDPACLINSDKKYNIPQKTFLLCLWKHEVSRVFSDKLRDLEDKKEFSNILEIIFEEENLPKESLDILKTDVYFADYLRDLEQRTGDNDFVYECYPKVYENIENMDRVRKFTNKHMEILNADRYKKHVEMVLFDDCLRSLMKITRVLQQDQGSCMLVGVGGSGKQSLTRLAAECEQNRVIQPTYGNPPKQDDLRAFIRTINTTIIEGYNPQKGKFWEAHTLLMTDAEFKMDYYLEVISSFLSTGEIANLYTQKNDKNAIIAATRTALSKIPKDKKPGGGGEADDVESMDESAVWNKLIEFGRKYIHVSLCFSPSSDKFREKFIKFPILFNNCTIIWLLSWPEEALISVVKGQLESNQIFDVSKNAELYNNLYLHMSNVHIKISENICTEYYDNFRRHVYVTPKSYLSFIQEYVNIYKAKYKEIQDKAVVIKNGLGTLKQAEKDIEEENKKAQKEFAKVEEQKKEVDKNEKKVSEANEEVSKIERTVSAQAQQCQKEADEISKRNEEVQKDLAIAMPKLVTAKQCIVNMEKNVLLNVASAKVAASIKYYFECSCLIMNKRLAKPNDFGLLELKPGVVIHYYYPTSWTTTLYYLKQGGYGSYFDTIISWQKKLDSNDLNINDETLELLRPLTLAQQDDGKLLFDQEVANKIGGDACKRIAAFCTSISVYVDAVRDVIPKALAVKQMQSALEAKQAELAKANEELAKVLADKKKLDDELAEVRRKRDEAQEKLNKMIKKVNAAQNLISSLAGEKERWTNDSAMFDKQIKQLLGDAAICSAFIAYAGPFNYTYRKDKLIGDLFKAQIEKLQIPFTEGLVIEEFLVTETKKNEWFSCKLPSDTLSVQNAILVTSSSRFPLLIDPQDQAKSWLTNTYPGIEEQKHVYQMKAFCGKRFKDYLSELCGNGYETIIEGIENDVDSTLDPLLEKRFITTKGGKSKALNLGTEDTIDYDDNFKLFLLCKLINPHFTPELAAKTTIIDFCVTAIGLEQQLQALVISIEQSELEERLKTILEDIRKNKASLEDCQKQILANLNQGGNLLENEEIVVVLNKSKTQAEENTKKIEEAEEKKKDINQKREKYLPVATRGSVLYFSIVQMQEISKMYSTSLQQFIELFNYSIDHSIQNPNTEIRVKNIIKKLSEHVYKYIVRGLFECHKTTFILLVCFKILTEEKIEGSYLLKPSDVSFFIKCGGSINPSDVEDCSLDFLGAKGDKKPKEYLNLLALYKRKFNDTHQYFQRLEEKIKNDTQKLKEFYNQLDAENNVPYEDLYNHNKKLAAFLKLLFVRALREDRTIICARSHFIPIVLDDKHFLDSYSEEIKDLHAISSAKTPILYLLSAGADPSTNIENLAKSKGKHIDSISMGEGQLEVAKSKVELCITSGDWVYFQNCHLGLDFMSELDIMLKDSDKEWNPEMRIWLSCEPRDEFPIGLLHQSLKVTNEPPKGIKNGMLKTYSSVVSAEKLDVFEFKEWRNLIFALSFIHSLVIERRKYGALGFCVPYDFNDSDLEASILFVEKQFAREIDIPDNKDAHSKMNFKTLTNVVSTILYGGRITDLKDESLFKTIVSSYLEDPAFKQDNYCFYPSGKDSKKTGGIEYKIPKDIKEIEDYKNYIKTFPDNDPPQVFGLHGSADMTFRLKEFKELIETITDALPKDGAGGGGASKEGEVKPRVVTFLDQFPEFFIEADYRKQIENYKFAGIGTGLEVPLNNCLLQEVQDVQKILELVKKSLSDIKDAIEGTLLMTETITECIDALYQIKPPKIWMFDANGGEISWLSPSASSWFEGLKIRCEKLREWLNCKENQRPPFFLPGILKPQGFLAAFRQEYFRLVRKEGKKEYKDIALDQVDLQYSPDKYETDPKNLKNQKSGKGSLDTIIIYGLYIEGAIWGGNNKDGSLQDDPNQNSRNTIIQFPLINCKGTVINENKGINLNGPSAATYSCPLYKYPKRTDKYIITDIKLRISGSDQDDKYWQRRGVALLCNKE